MPDPTPPRVYFEGSAPILRVEDMKAALAFYVGKLGFQNASWGTEDFTSVNRDRAGIYLCRGGQDAAAGGSGSASRTPPSCTMDWSRAASPSACRSLISRGRSSFMWKTRMGMCCGLGRNRLLETCVKTCLGGSTGPKAPRFWRLNAALKAPLFHGSGEMSGRDIRQSPGVSTVSDTNNTASGTGRPKRRTCGFSRASST